MGWFIVVTDDRLSSLKATGRMGREPEVSDAQLRNRPLAEQLRHDRADQEQAFEERYQQQARAGESRNEFADRCVWESESDLTAASGGCTGEPKSRPLGAGHIGAVAAACAIALKLDPAPDHAILAATEESAEARDPLVIPHARLRGPPVTSVTPRKGLMRATDLIKGLVKDWNWNLNDGPQSAVENSDSRPRSQ